MRVELPDLKRCCCFIPLRYGLVMWGYLRLLIVITLFSFIMDAFVRDIEYLKRHPVLITVISMFLLSFLVDIGFTVIFLIGGHQKSARLLRVSYIYNIVFLISYTILFTIDISMVLYYAANRSTFTGLSRQLRHLQISILIGIVYLGLLVYLIVATRSELRKPRYNHSFQFRNTAAECHRTLEGGTQE